MTDVYIDGIRLDFEDTAGDSTLGDLVLEVEKELKGIRRYVNLLSIDGESIEDWRAVVLKKAIHASAEVKLQTASFDEVALEGLDTLREYAAVIKENISSCVSSLRRGSPAGDGFSSVVEGVVEVVKTVDGLLRGGGMYGVALFRKDPDGCCASMIGVLESLKEAGQSRDSVTMADIIEYELAPLVKELEETLRLPEA
ncbi:MAG: hypothetical protein Q8P48_07000 [Deltaproteobacteria bacterium]|nr:hypothetical protein [Deltaproteobacteria bacterium]